MPDSSRELSENVDSGNSDSGALESVILMRAQRIQANKTTNTHKSALLDLMIKNLYELKPKEFSGNIPTHPIPAENALYHWVFPNIILPGLPTAALLKL